MTAPVLLTRFMKKTLSILLLALLIPLLGMEPLARAQSNDERELEYIEDEGGSLWDNRGFQDDLGSSNFDTGGGEYIGEEEAVQILEESALVVEDQGVNIEEAFARDRVYLNDNLKYGLYTGAVIGIWLATVQNLSDEGSNRQKTGQLIGVGIVGGLALGAAIGTKALYVHKLRADNIRLDETREKESFLKAFSFGPSKDSLAQLNFSIRF